MLISLIYMGKVVKCAPRGNNMGHIYRLRLQPPKRMVGICSYQVRTVMLQGGAKASGDAAALPGLEC